MTIFLYVYKRFFKSTSNVVFFFIIPIVAVFLPVGEWHPLPGGFQYYGIILLFIAARLASIISEDRSNRVLLRIGIAPITHLQYLVQNLMAYSTILIFINIVFVIAGVLVHGAILINPILLFINYCIFSFTAIGFSLAWYSLFRSQETAFSILIGIIMLMAMLGGMMWPVQIMPAIIQRIAMLLPTYWLAEGILKVALGATLQEILLPLAMMVMFSAAFIIIGSKRKLA